MSRQCPVETLPLDAGGLSNFGYALGLGEVAQGDEQNAGFVLIFQRRFEVLGGKIRVLSEPAEYGLVVGDAGFTFREASLLSL